MKCCRRHLSSWRWPSAAPWAGRACAAQVQAQWGSDSAASAWTCVYRFSKCASRGSRLLLTLTLQRCLLSLAVHGDTPPRLLSAATAHGSRVKCQVCQNMAPPPILTDTREMECAVQRGGESLLNQKREASEAGQKPLPPLLIQSFRAGLGGW